MLVRSFTLVDQEAFAALAQDFNPMHVDPQASFWPPVVHGIHTVLWGGISAGG